MYLLSCERRQIVCTYHQSESQLLRAMKLILVIVAAMHK